MFRSTLRGFRDVALLLARISLGVILVARGWWRWQVSGYQTQLDFVAQFDLPWPGAIAAATIIFELAGGVLLVFGLGTPIVGLGLVVLNVGIILIHKIEEPLLLVEGGYEYNVVLAAIGLIFLAFGPGRLGVDALFFTPRERREHETAPQEPPPPTPPARETEETLFHRNNTANS